MATLTTIQVLAEPNRQAILDLLREGERPVGELVEDLELRQPTGASPGAEGAGVIEVRPVAQRRLYRIRPEPLAELDEWLEVSPTLDNAS